MYEKLIFHKPNTPPRKNDVILRLTDIKFHREKDVSRFPEKRVEHAIETNAPGRIYAPLSMSSPNLIQTPFFNADDPGLKKLVKKYNDHGKRVFIMQPKKGIPTKLGKDAEEFINSKKGKRILRKINKDQDK